MAETLCASLQSYQKSLLCYSLGAGLQREITEGFWNRILGWSGTSVPLPYVYVMLQAGIMLPLCTKVSFEVPHSLIKPHPPSLMRGLCCVLTASRTAC